MKNLLLSLSVFTTLYAVDYNSEIQPIFDSNCVGCHSTTSGSYNTHQLDLTSYDGLMSSGQVIIAGNSESSSLWEEVDSGQMPPGNNNLLSYQIDLIAQWIDEGALEFEQSSCDEGFTYYNDLPQTVTIINGTNCLSDNDISVLSDIAIINNIFNLDPISLGTQNWANGRLVWLKIGNSFDGGNVSLSQLPDSIGNLTNLGMLFLDYNNLTTLPDSIGYLSNLIYLVLSFNNLESLPDTIGNLSYLLWLDLGYNQVSYIPETIEDLSFLQYLWLFNNKLESIPSSICNLDIDWSGFDPADLPYFGSGGNMLCNTSDIPECVLNSDNFDVSLEANYYSFPIYVPQDCEEDCPYDLGDINDDGIINILDVVIMVNAVVAGDGADVQCAADINGDGIINILDIVQLVNIIVS